jgi:UDPglucose--hexose-1-phosphate uridylyltransferase
MTYFVRFEKSLYETTILTPSTGFKPQTQVVERRKDTLLDRWCRINIERANRPKAKAGDASVIELVESSRATCPFCPDHLETSTPKFPESLVDGGRLRVGEAVALPNLFAFAQHHAVVVLTNAHFQPLDKLDVITIRNGIEASIRYLKAIRTKYPMTKFSSINWNHLPTAAASMVHPHFQVIADEAPTRYLYEVLKSSDAYQRKYGVNYWSDIVGAEEENNERYIGEFGASKWYTSFCGLGNNDVVGVVEATNLFEMTPTTINDFSEGLTATLRGYNALGVQGFNMSLFSGPLDSQMQHFKVHARIISRPDVKPLYTADTGFMERLHDEIVLETKPEDVASKIRSAIRG